MTTTKQSPDADTMARALRGAVDALLLATAFAQVEREKCDKIQRQLLGSGRYGGDGDPRYTYLLGEEPCRRYFADLDRAYREAGYNVEPGHCPALIAECLQTQAEWGLIEAAQEFFPDVTNHRLLCGTKDMDGLETRKKYLDLLCGLVINYPGYTSPLWRRVNAKENP